MLRQIPKDSLADSPQSADVTIVPITLFDWYRFNEDQLSQLIGKRWILMDYCEFGWDWDQNTSYLWGQSDESHSMLSHHRFKIQSEANDSYRKFDEFVRNNPPILTFQRELLQRDRNERRVPIEYTHWVREYGNDTKEEFLKRKLEVSYNWSRSHEDRLTVHAAIFRYASSFGYDVISEFSHVERALHENVNTPKWLSVHVPHYARIDVHDVQNYIRMSKVTIVMPGCGNKCFRHGEVCCDAIMAMPENNLAWSYPWHMGNSIPMHHNDLFSIKYIIDDLNSEDLYEIYANAMENGRNYRYDTYIRRWIIGNIARVI